jgi:transposase-like protein
MKQGIRPRDPQRRRYWEEVVRRWREGGQSVRAFCRDAGLHESAFYFWRRELTQHGKRATVSESQSQACPAVTATKLSQSLRRHRSSSPLRRSTPSFLPVQVVAPASECPGVANASHGVEIILARGRTVRVSTGFDRQTLADVLAVLEARPC